MKVGFAFPAGGLARTVYYDALCQALRARKDFTPDPGPGDLAFPVEDTTLETNWPRYARPETAFVSGTFDKKVHHLYLRTLRHSPRALCIVNMHPFIRVPAMMAGNPNIVVADINLVAPERGHNPRTIAMPPMPITVGRFDPAAKRRLATFRGVNSHPVRQAMMALNDVPGFACELVDRANHFGKLDAQENRVDQSYFDLLNESVFALVPRGDAEFSYRLLEVLSFGCIPVVLSDNLVLPFDRTIPWAQMALHVPEAEVMRIPELIGRLSPADIEAMQATAVRCYRDHLAGFDVIADTLLSEAARLIGEARDAGTGAESPRIEIWSDGRMALGLRQVGLYRAIRGWWKRSSTNPRT